MTYFQIQWHKICIPISEGRNEKRLGQRQIETQQCKHQILELPVWYLVLYLLSSFAACSIAYIFLFRWFHILYAVLSEGSLMILAPPTSRGLHSKTGFTFIFQCSCLSWLQFRVSDLSSLRGSQEWKKNPWPHQSSIFHASKTNNMWLTLLSSAANLRCIPGSLDHGNSSFSMMKLTKLGICCLRTRNPEYSPLSQVEVLADGSNCVRASCLPVSCRLVFFRSTNLCNNHSTDGGSNLSFLVLFSSSSYTFKMFFLSHLLLFF